MNRHTSKQTSPEMGDSTVMWLEQCHKPSPKSPSIGCINHSQVGITIFIGGMPTIPSFGWFMAWFYSAKIRRGQLGIIQATESDMPIRAWAP